MTARRPGGTSGRWRDELLLLAAALTVAACGGLSSRHGGRGETSASVAGSGGGSAVPAASGGMSVTAGSGGSSGTGTRRPTFEPGAPSEVLAAMPTEYANLGTTVALSGDTLAVGSPGPVGEASGDEPWGAPVPTPAVFVFRWDGENWLEEAVLTVSELPEPDPSDAGFGVALALEGDTLVVGAPYQTPHGASDCAEGCGRVHVFLRVGTEWRKAVELTPGNYEPGVQFGAALAISDGIIAVGNPGADSNRGAVHLFAHDVGNWREIGFIQPAEPSQNSGFGNGVALDHETLAVAAWERAYVFESNPWTEWILTSGMTGAPGGFFGNRLVLRGRTLVVAEYAESSNAVGVNGTPGAPYPAHDYFAVHSGAAHVYRRDDVAGWQKEAFLKSAHPVWEGLFGYDLALYDDTLLVAERQSEGHGAGFVERENESDPKTRGAVWIFQRDGSTWSIKGALRSPNGETGFASSVGSLAITERFVAVGALADLTTPEDPASGTPYAGGVFVWPW